jgi:hypothetical protein
MLKLESNVVDGDDGDEIVEDDIEDDAESVTIPPKFFVNLYSSDS